jgi:uncharacterized protein (TIGR02996 family)
MSDSTAQGFLDDIITHPDDDTPRLIFADWLEEHGDSARAEFIRVQLERARLPEWDARQVGLWLRERALIHQHAERWMNELPTIQGVGWETFRRGFVATATFASFAALLKSKATSCWAATPIEAISIHWPRPRDSCENIAPIPGLKELTITGALVESRDVERLADAPLLSTLRVLNISDASLGANGFRRLIDSPYLWNVTSLRLPLNSIGNAGVRALRDANSLTSLQELDLSEEDNYGRYGEDPIVDADGVESLTAWPGLAQVRSLTLSGNALGRAGLQMLLQCDRATGLKELILRDNGLTGGTMEEFCDAHPDLQLDILDLGENVLTDFGAAELARARCLCELKVLTLDSCEIELSGARALAEALFLDSLRRLDVSHNDFGLEGLHELLQAKPRSLHTLSLADSDLGDDGVSLLAESPAADTLLELNLAMNGLGDRSAEALAATNHLRGLLILSLSDNRFSQEAAARLADSQLGTRLAILRMRANEE